MHARPASVLTIAGSDSGGGAGIQADLKTIAAHGVHGLSAITALTAQNSQGVTAVHVPPLDMLEAQLDACFADFDIRAVKIGMLANADVIGVVEQALKQHQPRHVVLDPVMIATSGATLLDGDAIEALRRLLPWSTVVTPNIPEAAQLTSLTIHSAIDTHNAMAKLHAAGARAVLLKGAHLDEGAQVVDRLSVDGQSQEFRHPRLNVEGHGTGCTLAASIAAHLALGHPLPAACQRACDYVATALASAYVPGKANLQFMKHIH